MLVFFWGDKIQRKITKKKTHGDSSRDLFIQPFKGSRFYHAKKVTSRIARPKKIKGVLLEVCMISAELSNPQPKIVKVSPFS